MSALSPILRQLASGRLAFSCPGCGMLHAVNVITGSPHPRWDYNGDPERPTFRPSILVTHDRWEPPITVENLAAYEAAPWPQAVRRHTCHSYVTEGRIQFLEDCTHALRGQTVPLPVFTTADE